MNTLIHAKPDAERGDITLAEVDFKWLMAGQGCWVDTARLHQDSGYARACFAQAQLLHCEPLLQCVRNLSALLATSAHA